MSDGDTTQVIENIFDVEKNTAAKQWRSLSDGVDICYLYQDGAHGASAAYIRYAAGSSVKPHRHLGYEHIIVLRGEQNDERHRYREGCLAIQSPASRHTIASKEGCTVLAIWTAPVKFD